MKNDMKPYHVPVLLLEAVENLKVSPNKKFVDATLGGGGHTKEIIKRGGIVLGIDRDSESLEYVSESQKSQVQSQKLKIVKGNFSDIKKISEKNGFEKVDGILMDLGVSSHQLDEGKRGFSIRHSEKLDMRMDKNGEISAFEVVNRYPKEQLIEIFYKFGEEHNAKQVAEAIVLRRKKGEIITTSELANLVVKLPHANEAVHPATRIFQAIRMEVNSELDELREGLLGGFEILKPNGRMIVISFHSLEDRIVKQTFDKFKRNGLGTVVTKKPILPTDEEMKLNKRSRSAKLRVFEKK